MNARLFSCLLLPLLAPLAGMLAGCEWHVSDNPRASTGSPGATPAQPGDPSSSSASPSSSATCSIAIDRWKELLVINRSVLSDRRAANELAGAPWSFRTRLEELAGSSAEAPALAQAWLAEWRSRASVGPDSAPVTPRASVDDVILGPWRQSLDPNASSYPDGAPLPLDHAPFRLVAIANRLDLRERELGCEGAAGEVRFVYTAVDPKTRLAVPFSIIVEVPYPASRSPREWATRWHDVARLPFGAEYNDALATLTSEVTSKAVRTSIRVRTNEIALGEKLGLPWELREFGLDVTQSAPRVVQVPLAATPRIELLRSPSLDAWAEDNAAKVLAGTYVLPSSLQAGAAPMNASFFRWSSSTLSEELRHALSMGTCNGCHAGERTPDLLRFQHLAPGDTKAGYYAATNGETQVSRYLHDPSGGDDELGRRAKSMARMLCSTCSTQSSAPSYEP